MTQRVTARNVTSRGLIPPSCLFLYPRNYSFHIGLVGETVRMTVRYTLQLSLCLNSGGSIKTMLSMDSSDHLPSGSLWACSTNWSSFSHTIHVVKSLIWMYAHHQQHRRIQLHATDDRHHTRSSAYLIQLLSATQHSI